MELHNETTLTPEIICSLDSRTKRLFVSLFIILTTFIASSAFSVLAFMDAPSEGMAYPLVFLLLMIFLVVRMILRFSPRGVKRTLRKQMGEKMICRYVFKDEEVIFSSQHEYSSQEWTGRYSSFRKLKVKKKRYICLYFDSIRYMIVDKNGFASEEEWNQLLDFLKTKNL